MKILAFSDLHLSQPAANRLQDAANQADLIIGVGDFAHRREGLHSYIAQFAPWGERAIFVAGNNETETELRAACSGSAITVLHGESVTKNTITVAGIGAAVPPPPSVPWHSFDLSETQADALLAPIQNADILISHSPPYGIADQHITLGSIGSTAIRDAAIRLKPRWLLCGHIHDAWGQQGQIGPTRVFNLGPTPNWIELD